MDVLGERKSGMSNYKKIFCMSVYKIITIITFCVLLMIGSGTIFHAHNSVFMSVLQPAVRIAFLIILTINEQISNFAQTYPTNLKASSNEALLFMRRYRFANCSCFSCCFKDAYPSSNVQ